jgi:hypothetical protein
MSRQLQQDLDGFDADAGFRESCTPNPSKINICISVTDSVLHNVSESVLNQTYSSLTSAQPSARTYSFDPYELEAQTQTTLTRQASASSSSSSSRSTASSSQAAGPTDHHHSLSGGAIAGIVIGVLVGVAVIAVLVTFLLKRRKRSRSENPGVPELPPDNAYATPGPQKPPLDSVLHEMETKRDPSELPSPSHPPAELPVTPL